MKSYDVLPDNLLAKRPVVAALQTTHHGITDPAPQRRSTPEIIAVNENGEWDNPDLQRPNSSGADMSSITISLNMTGGWYAFHPQFVRPG